MLKKILLPVIFIILGWGFWVSPQFTEIAAGVAIFLFGMISLEEGFRAFTGGVLERLLSASTDRLWKSLGLGIITTTIMYWWGLGRFGDFSRPQQLLVTVAVYAALVVGATVWLRFFTIGPFEWLWRSLIYVRPQPMVRRSARS